jgi:hypothetical protein
MKMLAASATMVFLYLFLVIFVDGVSLDGAEHISIHTVNLYVPTISTVIIYYKNSRT